MKSYTVLYYKSKKKKHKAKGESKYDGTMTIEPPPKSIITLKDEDDAVVFRSMQSDISKKELEIDEIVQVGGYEVEILSKDDAAIGRTHASGGGSASTVTSAAAAGGGGGGGGGGSLLSSSKSKTTLQRPMTNSLLGKKRGLGATHNRRPLGGGGGAPLHPPTNRLSTQQQQLVEKRAPPPQPKPSLSAAASAGNDDSDDNGISGEDVKLGATCAKENAALTGATTSTGLIAKKKQKPLPSFQRHAVRKSLPSHTSTASHTTATTTKTADSFFPGAIGNLSVPHSIKSVLKPHQVEGVAFLWNTLTGQGQAAQVSPHCEDTARLCGCVLSDDMGMGKTIQTIAIISALHRQKRDSRFVVVTPSSLVNNWGIEFDKWLGKASQPKRVVVEKGGEDGLQQIKAFCALKPNFSEVLIISYDLFRMNISYLEDIQKVALLVVDEGHRLKNTNGSQTMTALKSLPAEARLCITATPIQNNLEDLFTLVDFACPGLLGDLSTFRSEYERPISACSDKNCSAEQKRKGKAQAKALDRIIKAAMLRRLQKDTLKKILPPRHDFLIFCRPTEQQCRKYKAITRQQQSAFNASGGGASSEALTALMALRKLCAHPSLLRANSQEVQSNKTMAVDISQSGKMVVLANLLREIREMAPDDKCVIISSFTSTLTLIEEAILKPASNLPSMRLDGQIDAKGRQNIVDMFNRQPADMTFALLLSSKAGGVGLNLVGANRIVIFDPDWNPATDIQAMGRVYRQGQKNSCFIYRLFTCGTVDEIICQRQIQKGSLVTTTIDAEGDSGREKTKTTQSTQNKFCAEEIRDCFTLKEDCDSDTKAKIGSKWPDYRGKESLVAQGCNDPALMEIAVQDASRKFLAFVHIVTEEDEAIATLDEMYPNEPGDSNDDDDDDDDEREAEFQDDGILGTMDIGVSDSSEEEFELE